MHIGKTNTRKFELENTNSKDEICLDFPEKNVIGRKQYPNLEYFKNVQFLLWKMEKKFKEEIVQFDFGR